MNRVTGTDDSLPNQQDTCDFEQKQQRQTKSSCTLYPNNLARSLISAVSSEWDCVADALQWERAARRQAAVQISK